MTTFEVLGLFWVILATGLFTAGMLIAALWSITLGVKVTLRRYRLGEAMERAIEEPEKRPTR